MPAKEKKTATKTAPKTAGKKTAAAKKTAKVQPKKNPKCQTSLFQARPKNFGIGQDVPYRRDLSRFMRWPTFVTLQRKKRVLMRRLKVPPSINQFTLVLDCTTRNELLKLIKKYAPETRRERRSRLKSVAAAKVENPTKTVSTKAPLAITTGLQQVTRVIEKKKAKLVIIANNVDPLELVMWMPALCRRNGIPYCIVKDKARLGNVLNQKTVTCAAFTAVRPEDETKLKALIKSVNARFAVRSEFIRKRWGGRQPSLRSRAALRKKTKKEKLQSGEAKS